MNSKDQLAMDAPETLEEIRKLILNQVPESVHLDYKRSDALDPSRIGDIAKDISSFANSDGGVIIYGVIERNQLPLEIDEGVEHKKFSRERLEQVIQSNIAPKIEGILIVEIPVALQRSVYSVRVPKSYRGPHQASDKRYYKRFNFMSVPMEDYEINDVRSRRRRIPPLVAISISADEQVAKFSVSNVGEWTAENVRFEFSEGFRWIGTGNDSIPEVLLKGIDYLPPGQRLSFFYGLFTEILKERGEQSSKFDVEAKYFHPEIGQVVSEVFHFDLVNYKDSLIVRSELYEHGEQVKESMRELTKEMRKIGDALSGFPSISGATGLSLSVSTLRNLKRVMEQNSELEKMDPSFCSHKVFKEVLGVGNTIALRLRDFFSGGHPRKKLKEVEGMTEELYQKINAHFLVPGDQEVSGS